MECSGSPASTLRQPPEDLPRLPRRHRDTSKRDYGRVLVVGGSAGMAGAPALTAMASLRSGAGVVEVVAPEGVAAIAAGFDPCVMVRGLPADTCGTFSLTALAGIVERAALADGVAVGPGLGRSPQVERIVAELWEQLPVPAVFDADALFALAHLDALALARHAGPRILTPHVGELLRFLPAADRATAEPPTRARLEQAAAALATMSQSVVVLKGPDTLVVEGDHSVHNTTGNPGMATAGSGDVLTGITAALVGQKANGISLSPFDAARLAVWVHGHAGDLAASDLGEISLTARDILSALARAFPAVVAPRLS